MRLDAYLVNRKMVPSRERAKEVIKLGQVFVNGSAVTKPAYDISEGDQAEVRGETLKYVSRGGLKLEKALEFFSFSPSGLICMDIGASTGGFTDCLLKNGAKKVYAVDVGTDQLAQKLREDSRVVSLEQTNIRFLRPEDITEKMDLVTVDVSFISLTLVLPVVKTFLKKDGTALCLIKPQFEAGKEALNKKGVVRSEKIRKNVVDKIRDFSVSAGFSVRGVTVSPILGPEGNEEYLIFLTAQ